METIYAAWRGSKNLKRRYWDSGVNSQATRVNQSHKTPDHLHPPPPAVFHVFPQCCCTPSPGYSYNATLDEWSCADGYLGEAVSHCGPNFQCALSRAARAGRRGRVRRLTQTQYPRRWDMTKRHRDLGTCTLFFEVRSETPTFKDFAPLAGSG